jgi:UDP-2,3-diacylglucosamine pyrophosphatase LpxH
MKELKEFNELHVVSDLHMGGAAPARQIFNQGETFARLIDILLIATPSSSEPFQQGLVINGDFVDFLAEPDAKYFDPVGAVQKLDRIIRDPSFFPVWTKLREFIKRPDRSLIFTLGNHDLELALPQVRNHFLQELSGGDSSVRERITLAFSKEGYSCLVGSARILCVHGNDVDPWNATDWNKLGQIGQDVSQGIGWTPNGGSQLVIDVMNAIKVAYPFVDLLKPETSAVLPTLASLKPSLLPNIFLALPALIRTSVDFLKKHQFLGEPVSGSVNLSARELANVIGPMLGGGLADSVLQPRGVYDAGHLLVETERRFRQGITPLELAGDTEQTQFLGIIGAFWNAITLQGKKEVLREALERLRKDQSFFLQTADATYQALNKEVADDVHFVVAGHTHLERALPLRGESRYYYNCGTWVRLMQLTDDILGDKKLFERVYDTLKDSDMVRLDAAIVRENSTSPSKLVLHRPAVVSFRLENAQVVGELSHVEGNALKPVPGSRFSRN